MYFYDNYYTLSEIAKTGYSAVLTKLFYKDARLIRRPCYIRGIPRIKWEKGFTTGYNCRIEAFGEKNDKRTKLFIGRNCKIGDNVHIVASERVEIGDNCLMASKIFISDTSHGCYREECGKAVASADVAPDDRELFSKPVKIGKNVWIGENVCILMGVTVGDGAIINSNAVVSKDVPANSIVGGVPARIIKTY